jgi:DNA-binding protein WhiA
MEKNSFKDFAVSEAVSAEGTDGCCPKAFLCAMLKTVGAIEITRRGVVALFATERRDLILKIAQNLRTLYKNEFPVDEGKGKNNAPRFELRVTKAAKQLLSDTRTMNVDGENYTGFVEGISREIVAQSCCAKSFVRGLFIGAGSVYVPEATDDGARGDGYHLEFRLADQKTANDLVSLLKTLGVNAKQSVRGINFLVYLKDKHAIFSLFQILSLAESALKLDSIIRERELSGAINRKAICEAANLDKSYAASAAHLNALQIIDRRDGLKSLPPSLRQTALAKIQNPRMSLQELADELGVSKSCLNHRLRKIMQIAQKN